MSGKVILPPKRISSFVASCEDYRSVSAARSHISCMRSCLFCLIPSKILPLSQETYNAHIVHLISKTYTLTGYISADHAKYVCLCVMEILESPSPQFIVQCVPSGRASSMGLVLESVSCTYRGSLCESTIVKVQ